MKKCLDCGKLFEEDIRFCPDCGGKLSDMSENNMWYCGQCGAKLNKGDKFCGICGARISNTEMANSESANAETENTEILNTVSENIKTENVKPENLNAENVDSIVHNETKKEKNSSKSKKKLWISAGVVIAVVALAGVVSFAAKGNKKTSNETSKDNVKEKTVTTESKKEKTKTTTEKKTEAETTEKSDASTCSFEELTGENSPLLGYWQSDNSGMYVGYNTTMNEEGFSVWMYTSDKGVQMFSDVYAMGENGEVYTLSGSDGKLEYKNSGNDVSFTVADDTNMSVDFQSNTYTGTNEDGEEYISKYEFKKCNLSEDMMDAFGYKWISADLGEQCEITYSDDMYHYTWIDKNGNVNSTCNHGRKVVDEDGEGGEEMVDDVIMYNGKDSLIFINPYVLDAEHVYIVYYFYSYDTCEEDQYQILSRNGYSEGISGEHYLYQEGSDKYNEMTVIQKYEDYINANAPYAKTFEFAYVDGDDIPELFTCDEGNENGVPSHATGLSLYTIIDGNVVQVAEYLGSFGTVDYYEKQGMLFGGYAGQGDSDYGYYKLENGTLNLWHSFAFREYVENDEIGYRFYIDEEEVDESRYESYMQEVVADIESSKVELVGCKYSTVYEAYKNLNQ